MAIKVKRLAILGSTGSIGQQTLDIVRKFPDRFKVAGLSCGSNVSLLKQQVAEFRPSMVSSPSLKRSPRGASLVSMEEMASDPDVDMVVVATTGKLGFQPVVSALRSGKATAIANKEVLVMAGQIITELARAHGAAVLPIDSEHSAIWQCLRGESAPVSRLLLTASGGPFLGFSKSRLGKVTVEQALNHPTWKMGRKVTIDSATLFNKGLEAIEAHWLFGIPYDRIEILVHRQSIVHSMVEFPDGSIKAQLGMPDMHLPIQYALFYPRRVSNDGIAGVDFASLRTLTLEPIKYGSFPCLALALEAARKGATYPAVLCAADDVAVGLFLRGALKFTEIAGIIERTMEKHVPVSSTSLDDVLVSDDWARKTAHAIARRTP